MKIYCESLFKEQPEVARHSLNSIYVGGGTPSFLDKESLRHFLQSVTEKWHIGRLKEYTFEMNPEDATKEKLKMLKANNVNRVSLGVQSMNDRVLKKLGRNHDSAGVKRAVGLLREFGFDNVNCDLIVSLPGQTVDDVKEDVDAICQLQSDHMSVYSLAIEKNSRFYVRNLKVLNLEKQREHYLLICRQLDANGFCQYEISNFAKQGKESLHNLNYWKGGDYYGLGVSAHSHIKGRRYWNDPNIFGYLRKIRERRSVVVGQEELSCSDKLMELLLFGLRLNEGVHVVDLEQRMHCQLEEKRHQRIYEFIEEGLLMRNGGYLIATEKGKLVLDEISARLI